MQENADGARAPERIRRGSHPLGIRQSVSQIAGNRNRWRTRQPAWERCELPQAGWRDPVRCRRAGNNLMEKFKTSSAFWMKTKPRPHFGTNVK